jgi:hypothetical protein
MRPSEDVKRLIKNVPVNTNPQRNDEILDDVLNTFEQSKNTQSASFQPSLWRIIMKSRVSKFAAAIIVIGVVLSFFASERLSTQAWAIEQTIEALKYLRAIHMVGVVPGGTAEIWMRANETGTQSTRTVVRGSHGAITWTKDGSTYHYEPSQNTVYFENAITIGMAQWLGTDLLEMLSQAKNVEVVRGTDAATGRDRVMLSCSMIDVHGPQSWIIEFDVASKLPVTLKQWQNLDRSGPPTFDAFKLTYYEDLPDSMFEVHIPGNPAYTEKPLTIPDENIGMLSDTKYGIPTEGLSRQAAAQKVIRMMYEAVIDMDLEQLKKICPLCENWGDKFLRAIVFRPGKEDRIEEILEIGEICKMGHSKLGPIAAVPTVFRLKNGKKVEQKMIVQFRQIGGQSSCVIHGPYGLPRELE